MSYCLIEARHLPYSFCDFLESDTYVCQYYLTFELNPQTERSVIFRDEAARFVSLSRRPLTSLINAAYSRDERLSTTNFLDSMINNFLNKTIYRMLFLLKCMFTAHAGLIYSSSKIDEKASNLLTNLYAINYWLRLVG